MKAKLTWAVVGLLLGACMVPVVSLAQSAASPPRQVSAAPTSGRFQLTAEYEGRLFMVDSATGRVWRYTLVTVPDSAVQTRVDTLIAIQEAQSGSVFTEAERKALSDKLEPEQRQEVETENNPCEGLRSCFVEVDRVRLTSAGWTSEVVR